MVVTALLLPVVLLLILFGLDAWEHLLFHQEASSLPPHNGSDPPTLEPDATRLRAERAGRP